jgi:hypothetical protein
MNISRRSLFKKLALLPAAIVAGKEVAQAGCAQPHARLSTLSSLHGQTISTAHYHNISTSEALEVLLDAAEWPADKRIIEVGRITTPHWFLDNVDAFDAIKRIQIIEGPGSVIYEDEYGNIVFEKAKEPLISESEFENRIARALVGLRQKGMI